MKQCRKCQSEKPLEEFNKCSKATDGRQSKCRECERLYQIENKDRIKARSDKYREENKEFLKTQNKIWAQNNKETVRRMNSEWRSKNKDKDNARRRAIYDANKDVMLAKQQEWKEANREKMRTWQREYMREYRRNNPGYIIRHRVSSRLRELIINGKQGRNTESWLGCTLDFMKGHIESQFTEGMTWERFCSGEIHLDHIRPCCSFDLTDPEQQKACFHWSNIQPLWDIDNLRKRSQDLAIKRAMKVENGVSTITS